jgi:hypothetical protein
MSLVLRNVKGSPLTYTEMDDNLTYLEGLSTTGNTLANTLSIGNETDGNNIKLSDGDRIFNDDGADLISGLELDPAGINNGTILFTQDVANENATKIDVASAYGSFTSFDSNFSVYSAGLETSYDSFGNNISVSIDSSNLGGFSNARIQAYTDLTNDESTISLNSDILQIFNLPTYADNAAAISGGLITDTVYKTSTGELRIVI